MTKSTSYAVTFTRNHTEMLTGLVMRDFKAGEVVRLPKPIADRVVAVGAANRSKARADSSDG